MANVKVELKKHLPDSKIYTGVEYIESTGTQYFELEQDFDYNTAQIYIDYQFTDITYTSSYQSGGVYCIAGYGSDYEDNLYAMFAVNSDGLYSYNYLQNTQGYMPTARPSLNRTVFERNNNGVFFNETKENTTNSYISSGKVPSHKIILFAYNYNGTISRISKMKLYRFKVGDVNGWKHNYVPCKRKSDNQIGLYDTITDKFYTNSGTGEFSVGNTTGLEYSNDIYVINKYNGLKSVESLSQSTAQPKDIYYGVVPSSGSVQVIDRNGEIAEMIRNGDIENSNVNVTIYAKGKMFQDAISNDSNYNSQDLNYSLELTNELSRWDSIQFDGMPAEENKSAYYVLSTILSKLYSTSAINLMLRTQIVTADDTESTVKQYLQNINIPLAYLPKASIRSSVDKVCKLAQLNVMECDDGIITFVSARPSITSGSKIISIPKNTQFTSLNRDIILKNKLSSVFVPVNNIEITYKKTSTKEIKNYQFDTYSSQYSDYTNIIDSKAYNSDITVLAKHIGAENNSASSGYFYNIIKYDISLPTENIKREFKFKWDGGVTLKNVGQSEETVTLGEQYINTVYSSDIADNTIISDWVNFSGTTPSSVKVGAPNDDIKIRMNANNTITVYAIIFSDYLRINFTQAESITSLVSLNVYYESYNSSFSEKLTDYDIELEENELLQSNTTYNSSNMANLLQQNILSDYENGILTGTISVGCLNYYNTDKTISKNWGNGFILEVGDIVRIDNDNDGKENLVIGKDGNDVFFKVTGRNFRHSGVPLIDLELQEIVTSNAEIQFNYTPITENDEIVAYAIGGQGSDSAMTNFDSKFTQITIPETYNDKPVTRITASAFERTSGYPTINIKPNIVSIGSGNSFQGQGYFNIINYNGRVPATLDTYKVDALLQGDIINIHKDVEFIGDALFRNRLLMAKRHTKINFQNGSACTLIGSLAFSSMTIDTLNLPSTLETIARNGFYDCDFSVLKILTIPASVTSIGNGAFYNCTGLNSIRFEQPANATITLGTEIFNSKTARAFTVYTDNETIKNYNWSGDNVTATILHLDGTRWEG